MCRGHRSYHHRDAEHGVPRGGTTTVAAEPATDPAIRASDADRERVAALLRRHTAEGRLSTDELEQRLEAVYTARTLGELEPPMRELPPDRAPRRVRHHAAGPPWLAHPLRVAALILLVSLVVSPAHPALWVGWFVVPWLLFAGPLRHRRGWPAQRGWPPHRV